MEIATVRNAIIDQLKNDADIIALCGADAVDYGLGRQFPESLPALRIIQLGRDEEEEAESGDGDPFIWVNYRFHLAYIFEIQSDEDEKTVEDMESSADRVIRKALAKDYTLQNYAIDIALGRTFFRAIPEKNKYFVIIELSVRVLEQASIR